MHPEPYDGDPRQRFLQGPSARGFPPVYTPQLQHQHDFVTLFAVLCTHNASKLRAMDNGPESLRYIDALGKFRSPLPPVGRT